MYPTQPAGGALSQQLVANAPPGDFELVSGFLDDSSADSLLQRVLTEATWRDEHIQMFGRRVRSPRKVCWYGEPGVGYRYSGESHHAPGWLPSLEALRGQVTAALGESFNFVLANLYQDHNDSMGWHADNEPELGDSPVIASISLGASRTFRVRPSKKVPGLRRTSSAIELVHGSLLIMRGRSQSDFQHALPKARRPCRPRVNLTFRKVLRASPWDRA